ncbi:MAG: DMT family transporter, partial [Pseudomonadota bacterium]
GWHILTGYGVSLIPAGRASIIAYLMPLFVAVFSVPVLGERMTWHKIAGLLLGIAGLAVLIGPDLIVVQQAPIGALCMVAAAFTWAIGTVLFKKFAWVSPVTAITGWQLLLAAFVIVPGALILEPVPDFAGLSQDVWIALLYLFALPMIFCQWAFLMVIRIFPAAVAAIGTLAVPVVGVYSSALVLGEPVGWAEFTALIMISAALFVVLVLPALAGRTGHHATRPSA